MGTLWELWAEISQESESLADPVLLECLQAGQTHRIFDEISNENLKSILSMINTLLNDPKNRDKGATIFNELTLSVHVPRLVGFQDAVISSLHLLCKNLGSHMVQSALANLVPKCKELPDVNQVMTSSVVGKIVLFSIEEFQDKDGRQPGQEIFRLLKVCLERYRGPCGSFRDKLEKALIPYMDHENGDLVRLICDILPLLSSTGGGGTQGDKHSKDWSSMVMRLMKSLYDCLYQLYSDSCPILEEENPFERGHIALPLPSILQPKVLLRISLLKRRLMNLLTALSSYLRNPLPAPKPVPARNILKMVSQLIAVNPIDLLNSARSSSRKEVIFLSALLPSIHTAGFQMLNDLLLCAGTNLLPDASSVEQIFSQVWKWIDVKNKSFENLKLEMYSSLQRWLRITRGNVTNVKTLKMWVECLSKDIQLEKETVELKFTPKSKKEKKQFRAQALSMLNSNTANTFILKNASVCESALSIINLLIPSLDMPLHKAIYQIIGKTHLQVYQSLSFPSPYDSSKCRQKLNECVLELVLQPNSRSNVSIGLAINFLKKGLQDPVTSVSSFCQNSVSILERIVHPVCPSLSFPSLAVVSTSHGAVKTTMGNFGEIEVEEDPNEKEQKGEDEVDTIDAGCQTEKLDEKDPTEMEQDEDSSSDTEVPYPSTSNSDLKQIMAEIRATLADLRPARSFGEANLSSSMFSSTFNDNLTSDLAKEIPNGNGIHSDEHSIVKRQGIDVEDEAVVNHFESPAKRLKMTNGGVEEMEQNNENENGSIGAEEVSAELGEMLKDFVDIEPIGL